MPKPYKFNVPTALIYGANQKFIYAKGGVRGGKTRVVIRRVLKEMLEQPGIKVLFTRTTGPALQSTILLDFDAEVPEGFLDEGESREKPNPIRVMKNGSRAMFIAYEGKDYEKAGSEEYGIIVVEEAALGTEGAWNYFKTRMSQEYGEAVDMVTGRKYTAKIERRHMFAVANSGGRNYLWREFRRDHPNAYFPWKDVYGFKDPVTGEEVAATRRYEEVPQDPEYFAVEWSSRVNYENLAQDYTKTLEGMRPDLRTRYVEADDTPLEGLYFPQFKRGYHTVHQGGLPMKGFIPPPHWPVYCGLDYGRKTPTVCKWITISEEGVFIAFWEYRRTMLSPGANARNIMAQNAMLMRRGMPAPKAIFADPSTDFNRGESETGKTIFVQLQENGLKNLTTATRDLDARILRIDSMFDPNPLLRQHPITGEICQEGWPMFIMTHDCIGTIQEYEEWEYQENKSDKKDPTEKPQEANDHGIDADGYMLVMVNDVADLDFVSQKMIAEDPSIALMREKEEYCRGVMEEMNSSGNPRQDGVVY